MKKYFSMLALLCMILISATACTNKEASQPDTNNPQTQESPESGAGNVDKGESQSDNSFKSEAGSVDVDLTELSSTMVYAEVYNIMTKPDDYIGKTIKMSGPYYASYYDQTDQYYHYVIIEDAAACCQQGLEFIWNGEHTYPDDYPEEPSKIDVIGMFGSYQELGQTYYYLAVDDIAISEK